MNSFILISNLKLLTMIVLSEANVEQFENKLLIIVILIITVEQVKVIVPNLKCGH